MLRVPLKLLIVPYIYIYIYISSPRSWVVPSPSNHQPPELRFTHPNGSATTTASAEDSSAGSRASTSAMFATTAPGAPPWLINPKEKWENQRKTNGTTGKPWENVGLHSGDLLHSYGKLSSLDGKSTIHVDFP